MKPRPKKVSINRLFGRKEFLTTGPLLTDDGVIVSSKDSVTVKLDRDTLTQRIWEVPSEEIWLTGAAGSVVFGAGRVGGTRALSVQDGREVWRIPTPKSYVSSWNGEITVVKPDVFELRSPDTAEIRRSTPLPWPASGAAKVCGRSLLIEGKTGDPLAVSNPDEFWLGSIDGATAELKWQRQIASECFRILPPPYRSDVHYASVVFGNDDLLVVSCDQRLFGLDAHDGRILWHAPFHALNMTYALTVLGDRAYLPGWHDLNVIDLSTGDLVATNVPPGLNDGHKPNPGVTFGDRVAFTYATGHVVVYDREGSVVTTLNARARFFRSIVVDGRLVSSVSGGLSILDASIWEPA